MATSERSHPTSGSPRRAEQKPRRAPTEALSDRSRFSLNAHSDLAHDQVVLAQRLMGNRGLVALLAERNRHLDRAPKLPIDLSRQARSDVIRRFSLFARARGWADVLAAQQGEVECDAIDNAEAQTTLEEVRNNHHQLTNRRFRLYNFQKNPDASWLNPLDGQWIALGEVTMDRNPPAAQGPVVQNGQPRPDYDDSVLTLHTRAYAGGNTGVATYLFPAVLGWIRGHLQGVQTINMNPAGGAASKTVMAQLSEKLGDPQLHGAAEQARTARQQTQTQARAQNPAHPGIGSGGGAQALNTWDTRLSAEHQLDLQSLGASPHAGLSISGDGMSLAGPQVQAANNVQAIQGQAQYFFMVSQHVPNAAQRSPLDAPHAMVANPQHPGAAYFQQAIYLHNHPNAIAANPGTAAIALRMARLALKSGAQGVGGEVDAGYQMSLTGPALQQVLS